ncbi:MAG: Hsp70 family protein, partial [Syntrophaceae bacterium]|nr:Hsp70 family protein [Syntrophaceae bacterium]
FLDRDLLYARQTDFRLTQSIFAPLQDALDRAGLKPEDIDFCMMAGGSSLIPQVREALKDYFSKSAIGYFKDPMRMQVAVARGAAWNSLYKAITGKNLIRPVLHEGLSLVTQGDVLYSLIPAQSSLPYPGNGDWARVELEVPPQKSTFIDSLLFKVVGTKDRHTIFNEIWDIPGSVAAGEELVMEYRITAGKEFQCQAYLKEDPDVVFEHTVENPLVNVVNPGSIRLLIEEKEEELKKIDGGSEKNRDDYIQLAHWYAELNQKERALNWLKTALHKLGHSDGAILNLQGNYYGELGDHAREEKFLREADKAAPYWGGPLFNLALSFYNRGKYKDAMDALERAMKKDDTKGPYLTLKAMCVERGDAGGDQKALYNQAIKAFGPIAGLTDWELGWYLTAVQKVKDTKAVKEAEKEKAKRQKKDASDRDEEVCLPKIKGGALMRIFG